MDRYYEHFCALALEALRFASFLSLAFITMVDQPSSTAATKSKKKGGRNLVKPFLDWILRPKSANASASPSNSNRVGSADLKVSSTYIGSLLVSSTSQCFSRRQCYLESGYVNSYLTDLANSTHHLADPTAAFRPARLPSSNVPDLLGSAMGQGDEIR